jgi:hypothetical protein
MYWSFYIENLMVEMIRQAVDGEVGSPGLLGHCHATLACVSFRCSKLNEAQASFERVIEFHTQARDVLGEANDVQRLGLDEAQASFERAMPLSFIIRYTQCRHQKHMCCIPSMQVRVLSVMVTPAQMQV